MTTFSQPAAEHLAEKLGNNDQQWMSRPDLPCLSESDKPLDIRYHADQYFDPATDPGTQGKSAARAAAEARKLCAGCEVKNECLAFALDTGEEWGVWGGLTARDRKKLRKNSAAA
jgi:hypothetical protein